jgi:DNA-binding protein HU-beta
MNKTQFARTLAEANGISYKKGAEVVDLFLGHLEKVVPQLGHGEVLNLTGYVKFTAKDVPARIGRNPQTGEEVQVAPTRSVRASIGATLKSAVKAV